VHTRQGLLTATAPIPATGPGLMMPKFGQNKHLKTKLLQTADRLLVERLPMEMTRVKRQATPNLDHIWRVIDENSF
jgi:hypothetical protein